jgi:hypothetical protein
MPKKRVGVSLRKPSPAPDAVPASPGAPTAPTPIAPAAISPTAIAPSTDSVAVYGAAAVAFDLGPAPSSHEAATPLEPVVVDAFVNGAAAALEKAASELPAARLQNLISRGPDGYRELTLYLPEKLAQELALHCLEHDLDMNRLVARAVQQILEAPAQRPESEWRQRTDDTPVHDSLLSVVARSLLAELGDWVRTVWATRRRGSSRAGGPVAAI